MAVPMDDSELMQRVQDDQLEFFDELVQRYRIPLTRVAISKLRDASQAEDIVQETFLAVYAARHTYKPEFAFRTWVWTILLNLCRKNWRKQNRKPQEFSQSLFETTSLGSFPEPVSLETGLSRVLQLERDELLFELLYELPEVQADAIRLRFFGELKYSEIARTMQSSLIGAKVRVKKGLLTLAKWLQKKSGETP
jgi:RNA polymerase sigma-70 factor, ECF subfamily